MIILILILSLFLNLYGINWGLPSQTRSQLVFPVAKENEQLFKILKDTRTEPKGNIMEFSHVMVNKYGTGRIRPQRLEFFPDRLPQSEPMVGLLRGYLLTGIEPDEQPVIAALSRMDPQRLNFNPHFFTYGGCFIYTVGLALKTASLLDWVTSTHDLSYYFENPEAIGRIYIVGRMVVALSVLLSIFLLYLIGKRLYDRETGLFAAVSFGISPGVVASAHVMKPHLFGISFVLLFLLCILKVKERGSRSWYILSGLSLGLAVGSAIYLAIFFVHLLTCHLLRSAPRGIKGYFVSLKDHNLLFALGFMIFAFLLTNPYFIISFKEVLYEKSINVPHFSFSLFTGNLSYFTVAFFYTSHGIFLSFLVVLGLFYSLVKGKEYWFLPLLPVLYFLIAYAVMGKGEPMPRYTLSLTIFTSLLAGIAAQRLLGLQKRWIKILIGFVFVLTVIHSFLYSFNFGQDASQKSTFSRSGEWINQNIPQGSSIGLMQVFTPSTTPPFDFRRFRITVYKPRELSSGKTQFPQYFVSARRIDDLLVPHYQLAQSFLPSWPLSALRFTDHFTGANRPVFVYKKIVQ